MIPNDELVGRYVTYIVSAELKRGGGSRRTHKVIAVNGRTLSVKDATGVITRIHPDSTRILGTLSRKKRERRKLGLEDIDWSKAKAKKEEKAEEIQKPKCPKTIDVSKTKQSALL